MADAGDEHAQQGTPTATPRYCGQWHRLDPKRLDTSSLGDGKGAAHCLYAYRTIVCLYVFIMFFAEMDEVDALWEDFQFLTHWGVRMVMVYYITSVASLIWLRCNKDKVAPAGEAPYQTASTCCGLGWSITARFRVILFTMSFCGELVIVLIYWFGLYGWDGAPTFFNLHVHLFLLIFIYVEFMLTRMSLTAIHMLYVILLAVLYTATNGIATLARGDPVYSIITWEGATTAMWFIMSYIVMGAAFFVAWGMELARDKCCCSPKPSHARIEGDGDVEMGAVVNTGEA